MILLSGSLPACLSVAIDSTLKKGEGPQFQRFVNDVASHINDYERYFGSYFSVYDQKASGVDAGSATTGAYVVRTLNTESPGNQIDVKLSGNGFTLPAGTWFIQASAPGNRVDRHKIKLKNTTTTSTADSIKYPVIGSSEFSSSSSWFAQTNSILSGIVSITEETVFTLLHGFQTAYSGSGLGLASNFGGNEHEIYARVTGWRLK